MQSIRELREAAGLTQMQLAVAIGASVSAVYKWERGINKPKASHLKAMARLFQVNMEDIDFEGEVQLTPVPQATEI
jgi:transcriptional regulator with XRE-family HTH domain